MLNVENVVAILIQTGTGPNTLLMLPMLAGKSARSRTRKPGVAAPPDDGPAKTVLADSLAHVAVSVPEDDTGEPLTLNSEGRDKPTEVTVPKVGVTHCVL